MPARTRPKSPDCRFYRAIEVAAIFDISERTVWTWSATGTLPEPMHMPGWTGWRKEEIDAVVAGGKVKKGQRTD